ncbi:hypothetical protein K2173_023928 [Erythroxylum novogranatense]|uniref:Uncharacterized protein n=1 Tax=Erythroxylum novogranatense TaxID=1862640 RepID=A0AAV8TT39_9ROSI|nr:hypothetical protein K2173_023928 [Erythroxylum novogranatense]
MALYFRRKWRALLSPAPSIHGDGAREFRSDPSLELMASAREEKTATLVLYIYPSFSGAFSALFAHLFHLRCRIPSLIMPFSSVEPLRVEDFRMRGLERCYLLDFLGSPGFASTISLQSKCEVIGFDHRKSTLKMFSSIEDLPEKVKFFVDVERSSSNVVYEHFTSKLVNLKSGSRKADQLLDLKNRDSVEMVLKYIEDVDLRRWSLPDTRAFNVGLSEKRTTLNCITNPHFYGELLAMNAIDLISKGKSYISSREDGASKLLDKVFKVRLRRGFYGECLGVRADGHSYLSDEIGKQLSIKSSTAGLRPIGAVVYWQRNNLKICLRTIDSATDTSEVAKAYGGGGSSSSSSFIIRMDEYNQWLSA